MAQSVSTSVQRGGLGDTAASSVSVWRVKADVTQCQEDVIVCQASEAPCKYCLCWEFLVSSKIDELVLRTSNHQ